MRQFFSDARRATRRSSGATARPRGRAGEVAGARAHRSRAGGRAGEPTKPPRAIGRAGESAGRSRAVGSRAHRPVRRDRDARRGDGKKAHT
jgi:hypothetical protein